MEIISIQNVCKNFKTARALENVNIDIQEGELFGLLGVNGAGKTTLIKILCGLTKKSSGSIVVGGFDIDKDLENIKEIVDISPQETSIASNLTVQENLDFFANIYGKSSKDIEDEIVKTFGLQEVLDQKAKTLSGGFKRRLSIAIALISKPKILFLDEPTLGLDVFARRELWEIIQKLKTHMTIILTSHYMEEVDALCDRVAILSHGRVLNVGTIEDIKDRAQADTFENAFIKIVEKANE